MYKVIFNTAAADTRNKRRDWERQLIDDFIRAVHRKEFDCNDDEALADRLGFIADIPRNTSVYSEMQSDDANYVALQSEDMTTGGYRLPCTEYRKDMSV